MRYSRCKCGKCEYYDSGMPPQPCQGCKECGTTFAGGPDGHKPLEPHEWEPRFDSRSGKPARPVCKRCHEADRDWVKPDGQ